MIENCIEAKLAIWGVQHCGFSIGKKHEQFIKDLKDIEERPVACTSITH